MKLAAALAMLVGAAGGAPIVPTPDPGSDCVAAKIHAKKTAANRRYDEQYCAVNKDRKAFDTCMKNVSWEKEVAFFTDRCNPEEHGAYVSFNGNTHQVWRRLDPKQKAEHFFGTWLGKGNDLAVRIVPRKRLSRTWDEDAGREFVSYAVDVHIRYQGRSATIKGTYDNSW